MNVLITGGAGFIGSHLVERLLERDDRLRILDNLSTGKIGNLPPSGNIDFIQGDIRDLAVVSRCVEGMDAIVHLAAVASVQASIDDPVTTHQSNLDGTLHLLEAARQHGIKRFLYASSAAVYGDTDSVPVAESELPNPLSPYAADKLAGEHYLRFYCHKFGLKATAFRFFNIYGPRQDPSSPYSGVISIFTNRLAQNQPATLFGDGRQTRDFVYVGDLAALLAAALRRDDLGGQVLNVGTGRETNLLQLLGELEALSGRQIERRHAAPRVGDIIRSCADVTRLTQVLGAPPATSMRDGLRHLLDFQRGDLEL
jgi:UDP-glucose 4-epimerase